MEADSLKKYLICVFLCHIKTLFSGEINRRSVRFPKGRPLKNAQFCSRSRKARIQTTGIPVVFRGLEFESDAACPAIALATVEDWAKGGIFQGSQRRNRAR